MIWRFFLLVMLGTLSPFPTLWGEETVPTDNPVIMPLSEVETGMTGYGLTVFEGTKIERFGVEVLGISKNFYPKRDVIIVRLSGPRIEHTGVISGMSGSPIYLDDRLVGALAYRFGVLPKEPIAGITPIEQMLDIEHLVDQPQGATEQLGWRSSEPPLRAWIEAMLSPLKSLGQQDLVSITSFYTPPLQPIRTPLLFSGFDPRIVQKFTGRFKQMGFVPIAGGGDQDKDVGAPLEPGSAVAIQLIRGDINVSAVGTVTYRDNQKVLAFGHPVLWTGAVTIPMTQAEVITVLADQAGSYKMSNTLAAIGAFLWDHTSGVFGRIGSQSKMMPVAIDFQANGQAVNRYRYEVMLAKSWTPALLNLILTNTIMSNGSLFGETTIAVKGKITLHGQPNIVVDDLFSGDFTSSSLARDLTALVGTLFDNRFTTPTIDQVELGLNSVPERRTARIERVWFNKEEVAPGQQLELTLFLRPYRGQLQVHKLDIPIPDNIPDGYLTIQIGNARSLTMQEARSTPQRFQPVEMHQLIALLNSRRTNNKVYVKVSQNDGGALVQGYELPALPPSILAVMGSRRTAGGFVPLHDLTVAEYEIPTDYVISGQSRLRIQVKRK